MKKLESDSLYNSEMQTCTDEYLDYITGVFMSYPTRPYIQVERKLDLSNYAPESFGTGDCIIIGGDTLHVIDYKHGKGVPVEVEENPQLMLYGLGALEAYRLFYSIKKVTLTIFQPRADGDTVKEWTIDRDKLIDWGVFTVRPVADAAFKGEGEYCPGDWCRFCRAKAQCRTRAKTNTALEAFGGANAPSKAESGKFPMPRCLRMPRLAKFCRRRSTLKNGRLTLKNMRCPLSYPVKKYPDGKLLKAAVPVHGITRMKHLLPREGRVAYYRANALSVFFSGFLIVVVPLLLQQMVLILAMPFSENRNMGSTLIVDDYATRLLKLSGFLKTLQMGHPYFFNVLTAFCIAITAGIVALCSYSFSLYIQKNRLITVLLLPILLWLVLPVCLANIFGDNIASYAWIGIGGDYLWWLIEIVCILFINIVCIEWKIHCAKDELEC